MGRRDFFWLALLAAVVLGLAGPALIDPGRSLFNFGDLYSFHYPLRHLVKSELETGRLPFWNPFILGGMPLLADTQSAAFDPAALPGIFFPLSLGLSWACAFWIFWAALGCHLLARSSALSAWAAAAAGGLFSFSPFLVYRITEGIPTLLASLAWIPWAWLAFLSARPAFLAGVLALQFFSGHPQFLVINAGGMALWACARGGLRFGSAGRRLIVLAAAGAALTALTAVELIPFREFLVRSVRSFWPPLYAAAYALSPREAAAWLFPWMFSTPFDRSFVGHPSVFFETSGIWLGSGGIALAVWGFLKGKPRGFRRAAATLIAAGLFLGAAPRLGGMGAIAKLGVFHYARTPSRNAMLCLWGAWMLVCAGLKIGVKSEAGPWPVMFKALVILSVAEIVFWDRPFWGAQENAPYLRANLLLAEKIAMRPFRVLTDPDLANPNKTILYRAMNANGYSDLYLGSYARAASAAEGRPAADASRTYITAASSDPMRELAVSGCIGRDGRFRRCGKTLRLAHFLDLKGGLVDADPRPKIRWGLGRWKVEGAWPPEAAALALSVPFYPGWRGSMEWGGGRFKSVHRRPAVLDPRIGFLTGLPKPAGLEAGTLFRLDLFFETRAWPLWAGTSALAWVILLGVMLRRGAAYAEP